jgi:hypothetical protein
MLDSLLLSESVSVESEDSLLRFILKLNADYGDLLRHITIEFLSESGLSLLEEHFEIPPESVWQSAVELITHPSVPPSLLDSRIISDFPEIFAEFRKKQFSLLWRDSRNGFTAKEFHGRCDGHGNTLTVIFDRKGNIFGGFTPLKWESRVHNGKYGDQDNRFKTDDSQKSFLFTLKNPHNIAARRFVLKSDEKHKAIWCASTLGPYFGSGTDLGVNDNCNTRDNCTHIGGSYLNDTGLEWRIVLAGSQLFKVKEIEVFEITV